MGRTSTSTTWRFFAAAWRRAQTIASRALDGFVMAEVGAATHFHTLNVAPMWGPHLMRVAQVGMHVFYRFNSRATAPAADVAQPTEIAQAEPPAKADMEAKGAKVLGEPRIGAHGTPVIFVHPRDMGGVLVELMETPKGEGH